MSNVIPQKFRIFANPKEESLQYIFLTVEQSTIFICGIICYSKTIASQNVLVNFIEKNYL